MPRSTPSREIGSGSAPLSGLLRGEGSHEVAVPLVGGKGGRAGRLLVAVQCELGDTATLGERVGCLAGCWVSSLYLRRVAHCRDPPLGWL